MAALLILAGSCSEMLAQEQPSGSAAVPAGAAAPIPASEESVARAAAASRTKVSQKQAGEAEDAYLDGARHVERNDLPGSIKSFTRAVELNPTKQEYVLALAVVREHTLTALVQDAAKARLLGKDAEADALLVKARVLDPDNSVVAQHALNIDVPSKRIDPEQIPTFGNVPTLGGPIEFVPEAGKHSIHSRGGTQDLVRDAYRAFGIKVTFDPSVSSGAQGKLDLEDVDFATAARIVNQMTHVFAVPVEAKMALVAKDSTEERDRLIPLVEENVYLPGMTGDQMNELATLARTIFDLKQVTASPATGDLLVRGDEGTLRLLNATYADMLDGGSDVLLDVRLYEIDKTHTRTLGTQLPSSVGAFSVAAEAQQLISANQTLLNQAIANGANFTGNTPLLTLINEAAFLIASGAVSATQFTNLIGTLGGGLSLAGVYLGSNASFNALLNSSDTRTLDAIQIRAGNNQATNFRAGSRYPVITSTYNSGISSALSSQLSGLNINGTNVGSLLSKYLGSSSVSVPQIQYEDLGVTLKTTARIQRDSGVSMQLDLKIEALAGGSINNVPILNNRQITSTINIPSGQTALLVSQVSRNESKAIQGLPYLSELPGFQGTYRSDEMDTGELLITITPHIVRSQAMRIASRRLSMAQQGQSAAPTE